MELAAIFEKAEANVYRLLLILKASPNQMYLKQLMEETSLSRSTLLKYISLFNELARKGSLVTEIRIDEDVCWLEMDPGLEWVSVINLFIQSSSRYLILKEVFSHHSFTIQSLSQKLMISEATLNRHLSALNDLLKEFSIAIYNGRLKGPEHQIRYFYWLLFQNCWTFETKQDHLNKEELQKEGRLVERLCHSPLSTAQKNDIALWSFISQKRWSVSNKETSDLSEALTPYAKNVFFQRLEKAYMTFLSRYALEMDESEAENLFAFLLSMLCLPSHTMAFVLGFGGPVADQMTDLIRSMRRAELCGNHLPDQITSTLGQILHRRYFFRGDILVHRSLASDSWYNPMPFIKSSHRQLAAQLFPNQQGCDLMFAMQDDFLSLLSYLMKPRQGTIYIGLHLAGGELVQERLKNLLENRIAYHRYIQIEAYDESKTYQGIVSDLGFLHQASCPIYHLKGPVSLRDIEEIAVLIKDLLREHRLSSLPYFPTY
ncbi:regulatory protein [Streptococcus varani]|uniref:Regulatory protein n=1 Tax=Streptococcus varani TaxID=1608583 RepID=A0A0E4H386_9STRE|nr:helix-turn-helix domain-containing protein [Streptococcus varani]CQR23851.1 regulatory protein [Streptococcus varani]